MGRNCFRSISITGGADRVCMAITYISLLLAIESTGFNVQPLGNDSRSILYSTSGFFNEDNYTNRTEGKFACCRGHRDTVEGASKRIKHTSNKINKTKLNSTQNQTPFVSFVRRGLFFECTILQRFYNSIGGRGGYWCFENGGSSVAVQGIHLFLSDGCRKCPLRYDETQESIGNESKCNVSSLDPRQAADRSASVSGHDREPY